MSSNIQEPPRGFPWPKTILSGEVTSLLDVGCGNGQFLRDWATRLGASRAVGVEPNIDSIKLLRKEHQRQDLDFVEASIHDLPFGTGEFDLVTAWSVLHWVGRDEYLQALGELVRVTSRYLVVMDFVAAKDHRVPYSHVTGLFTYKADFVPAILSSGVMRQVEEHWFWNNPDSETLTYTPLTSSDIAPFDGNRLSYHSRRMVVFEKDYDLLPLLNEESFAVSE